MTRGGSAKKRGQHIVIERQKGGPSAEGYI